MRRAFSENLISTEEVDSALPFVLSFTFSHAHCILRVSGYLAKVFDSI
jgi:hypothetical protein